MKNGRDFRNRNAVSQPEDLLKRATRLDPIKKNGKEKRVVIDEEDEEDVEYHPKRESIFDYYDDPSVDEDDGSDEEEDYDEDWEDEESDEYGDDDYDEDRN